MHELKPFTSLPNSPSVFGHLAVLPGRLKFKFRLSAAEGVVRDGLLPQTYVAGDLSRRDELWRTTCFEAFWGEPGRASYWELNISATKPEWNLYFFDDYRSPSPPRQSQDAQLERLEVTRDTLEAHLSWTRALPRVEASLCVIVNTVSGPLYYSTAHAGAKPDFHLRQSFVLKF